eukprot:scaffold211305_cov21-Tisochrysis_lutea.AAC.1
MHQQFNNQQFNNLQVGDHCGWWCAVSVAAVLPVPLRCQRGGCALCVPRRREYVCSPAAYLLSYHRTPDICALSHWYSSHERRWFSFDDSYVSPIDEKDVCSPAAYLLFYRRTPDMMREEQDPELLQKLRSIKEERRGIGAYWYEGETTPADAAKAASIKDCG